MLQNNYSVKHSDKKYTSVTADHLFIGQHARLVPDRTLPMKQKIKNRVLGRTPNINFPKSQQKQ
jgi:hypothetical protein